MLLSTLAEELTVHLNSAPERWAGEEEVTSKTELDPSKFLLKELGVYVLPQFVDYNVEISKPRGQPKVISNVLYVSMVVSRVFLELPMSDGVANWPESKVLLDIRQRAELWVLQYSTPSLTILSVDAEPLEELELNNRNFVALTTFGFQQSSCGTEDLLPAAP